MPQASQANSQPKMAAQQNGSSQPSNQIKSASNITAWLYGFIGVCIFSGSLPATRIAVQAFDPWFLTFSRASIAALLAVLIFCLFKPKQRPNRAHMLDLFWVAIGVVIGFPLFSALALQYLNASNAIVFIGLLPICTALFAVLFGENKPAWPFWFFAALGALLITIYAFEYQENLNFWGIFWMLNAIIFCGLGYFKGAKLSRSLGSWQVICWALIFSSPLMLVAMFYTWPMHLTGISTAAWLSLTYVSGMSMLIGFIFWYKGLAMANIAAMSQLQLLQPLLGLALAAWLLKEQVSAAMLFTCMATLFCIFMSKRYSE